MRKYGIRCVAGAVLLERYTTFRFILGHYKLIIIVLIDCMCYVSCNYLTEVVFKKVQTNDIAGPKSTSNDIILRIHYHLVILVWVSIVRCTTMFLVNITIY